MSDPNPQKSAEIPAAPWWLGVAGLLPFSAAALIYLFARSPEQRQIGLQIFHCYSAIILSFLGGVRWGAALVLPSFRLLFSAVMPSLIAAGCLLIPAAYAVPILAVTYFMVGYVDCLRGAHALWPLWFKRLRLMLSVAVVAMHVIVLLAMRGG